LCLDLLITTTNNHQNYGADWGDFVSFTRHMKQKARKLGVDLLLVDTGVSASELLLCYYSCS
jgi:hypothetical protein